MNIEKRLQMYYKRWNIELNEEESFTKFKHRLINTYDRLLGDYLTNNSEVDRHFFDILKIHEAKEPRVKTSTVKYEYEDPVTKTLVDLDFSGGVLPNCLNGLKKKKRVTERGFSDTQVYNYIKNCGTSQELATATQFLFWVLEERSEETKEVISALVKEINSLSSLTPSVSFQVCRRRNKIFMYPLNDQFLDEGIINYVISGLEDYPKVAKHFEEALKIYQDGDESRYRNSLDNLRFSLEQLFQTVLNNSKTLENNKTLILSWIAAKGLNKQVTNLYEKLIQMYSDYQNNVVKHNEKFSFDEIEFMIYLTGTFIRLILQLNK